MARWIVALARPAAVASPGRTPASLRARAPAVLAGLGLALGLGLGLGAALPALADEPEVAISIRDHQFVPSEINVTAGQKIKIVVKNEGKMPSEFESVDFHREKVVPSGKEITLFVGPLNPGSYEFFDDFHPDTRGHLVAK